MINLQECYTEAQNLIKENDVSSNWFIKAVLDNEKEYFVCLDSTFPHDMDIPILVINKVDGQISVHQIVEKGFMNKLNKAKLVARKLELDEDEDE